MRQSRSATLKMIVDKAPNDRQINKLPQPYLKSSTPYAGSDFRPEVKSACLSHRLISASLKISKIIILGNVAVGKSCLVNRFCHSVFDQNYKATIGVDFEVERFDILQVPFNLQIWDTAGQERFKCIASSYYRGAHAVVVAFDLTNLYSLSSCPAWLEDALKANTVRPLVFLVGTKRDLLSEAAYKHVEDQATRMARALQAEYWCVSSKFGLNVDAFFQRIAALTFNVSVSQECREIDPSREIGNGLVTLKKSENPIGGMEKRKRLKNGCCNS
ncbi:ras-related protein Rab-34-like [Daphnia carinata]|uniref:ras-related protein Rab-34-like n=1 Tax=Daphnia carinata TaxID=120202 RepID=UPI00257B8D2C|nr:ras-related protein Rab-34-like [Daphnia carinata]